MFERSQKWNGRYSKTQQTDSVQMSFEHSKIQFITFFLDKTWKRFVEFWTQWSSIRLYVVLIGIK